MRRLIIPLGLCALAACSTGKGFDDAGDLAKLEADCAARGGTLVPSGKLTGEVALDNLCRIPPSEPRTPN